MGYTKPSYITVHVGWFTIDPLDSTTYYGGAYHTNLTTTPQQRTVRTPMKGVIRAVMLTTSALTAAGTGEDITISLRVNHTTDYLIETVSADGAVNRVFDNQNLNIPIDVTDYFELKVVTPAWVTNPQGWRATGEIVVEVA